MSTAEEVRLRQIESMRRMVPIWIATAKAMAEMQRLYAARWGDLVRDQTEKR